MANARDVNLLEQHVEKIVLGICVLVLVLVLMGWVVASPQQIPVLTGVGTAVQKVPPSRVDTSLAEAARRIDDQFRRQQAPRPQLPDYESQIARAAAHPFPPAMIKMVELGTPGPQVAGTFKDSNQGKPPTAQALAEVIPPPGKPLVNAVMQLARSDANSDVQAAYGTCPYPWNELKKEWEEARGQYFFQIKLAALRVEVQVRSRLPEGDWSQPREATLVRGTAADSNKPPPAPRLPNYDGTNLEAASAAVDKVLSIQQNILTPGYPAVYDQGTGTFTDWRVNLPKLEVEGEPAPAPAHAGGGAKVVLPFRTQFWFQDNTLRLGRFYQYRTRLILLNPLYADNGAGADANLREMPSPWSEWSDEQIVYNPTRFFLQHYSLPLATVPGKFSVVVFTRKFGQPVMEAFDVVEGSPIGSEKNILLYSPAAGQNINVPTNFSTGAVCVELDFDHPVAKARSTTVPPTKAMVYLDENGELKTRLLSDDVKPLAENEEKVKKAKAAHPGGPPAATTRPSGGNVPPTPKRGR